jgi:hypothetical protein
MSPPIILVGTNKNGLSKDTRHDVIRKKFERIREYVAGRIYASHILEPYFALENGFVADESSADLTSDDAVSNDLEVLKQYVQIAALSEPYMGEQQPLKWMNFEKSLEKLKNKGLFYASLSQVRNNFVIFFKSEFYCMGCFK